MVLARRLEGDTFFLFFCFFFAARSEVVHHVDSSIIDLEATP